MQHFPLNYLRTLSLPTINRLPYRPRNFQLLLSPILPTPSPSLLSLKPQLLNFPYTLAYYRPLVAGNQGVHEAEEALRVVFVDGVGIPALFPLPWRRSRLRCWLVRLTLPFRTKGSSDQWVPSISQLAIAEMRITAQRPLPQIGGTAVSYKDDFALALVGLAGWNCLGSGVPGFIGGHIQYGC